MVGITGLVIVGITGLVMVGIIGLKGEYAHVVESVSLIQNDSYGSVYVILATTSNQVNSSVLLS